MARAAARVTTTPNPPLTTSSSSITRPLVRSNLGCAILSLFVLACGLRIVVRLGLVPLLRRKKAADGRARREPRRPTPGYLPSRDPAQTPHDTHSSCTVHVTECAHRYTGRWCQMGMGVGSASELLCTETKSVRTSSTLSTLLGYGFS